MAVFCFLGIASSRIAATPSTSYASEVPWFSPVRLVHFAFDACASRRGLTVSSKKADASAKKAFASKQNILEPIDNTCLQVSGVDCDGITGQA